MKNDLEEANLHIQQQDLQRTAEELNNFAKLKDVLNETLSIHPKNKIAYELDQPIRSAPNEENTLTKKSKNDKPKSKDSKQESSATSSDSSDTSSHHSGKSK